MTDSAQTREAVHTPEPWRVDTESFNRDEDKDEYGTIAADDWCVALVYGDLPNAEANARRIVACVNARRARRCGGAMNTPIIESESGNTHSCAPFCTSCNHRLVAFGIIRFDGGYIDSNGWWGMDLEDGDRNKLYEEDCIDLDAHCVNEQCTKYLHPVFMRWCYDEDSNRECAKEDTDGSNDTGKQSGTDRPAPEEGRHGAEGSEAAP